MIDILNEKTDFNGAIELIKPIEMGDLSAFKKQDGLYTVVLRGLKGGREHVETRLVTSVSGAVDAYKDYEEYAALARVDTLRFIISNTTEAGIVYDAEDALSLCPPRSFPGKLTKLLLERAEFFHYAPDKGLVMLPVELIDDNGARLKECVLKQCANWKLPQKFVDWVNDCCIFASTLVDRIVTGYPRDEKERENIWQSLGYADRLLVTAEPFALWVIESEKDISHELPFAQVGLPVIFTDNQKPYKQRKVRILNGAHTSFVPAAFLMGHDTVREAMGDQLVRAFMRHTIFDEVIPTLDLPREDLVSFADAVTDRFDNPFIRHMLLSITLNCVSKWRARCMPSLLEGVKRAGKLPGRLAFSLAALIAFDAAGERKENGFFGLRGGEAYQILDDAAVLDFFVKHHGDSPDALARATLANENFWGMDLTKIEGLLPYVSDALSDIRALGARAAMEKRFPLNGGDR